MGINRYNPFKENAKLYQDIVEWQKDPLVQPQNQNRYYFSDAKSYYENLCQINKLLSYFNQAFETIYDNEEQLDAKAVTIEQLNNAINELRQEVIAQIQELDEDLSADISALGTRLTSAENTLAQAVSNITSLQNRVLVNETDIETLNEEMPNKLEDVILTGSGFTVTGKTTVDGVETITIAVESESGGTVTSITAGNGLTGGTITDSGTIAVDFSTVASKDDLDDYIVKDDAPGYSDILTQTDASTTYETIENVDTLAGRVTTIEGDITEIDQDIIDLENGKQDNLTTEQLNAVNSGITQSQVNRLLLEPIASVTGKELVGIENGTGGNEQARIQIGNTLSITGSTSPYTLNYTLPTASTSVLGGVKYPINATNVKDNTQNKTQAQLNALLCNKSTLFYWWGTYPKGHQSGVNTTTISVPMVNPLHKTYAIESVYVYDESGNFTQITNATIGGNYTNFIEINMPYVSSHAGKLIRIGLE